MVYFPEDKQSHEAYVKMGREGAISFVEGRIQEINEKITKLHIERNKFQQHLLFLKQK